MLRRHVWLQSCNISDDSKAPTEDLPFDGVGLFNTQIHELMDDLYKKWMTAKLMMISLLLNQLSSRQFRQT